MDDKRKHESLLLPQEEVDLLKAHIRTLMERIEHLEERERFLNCLESVGVDNWTGYDMAQAMFRGEDPYA